MTIFAALTLGDKIGLICCIPLAWLFVASIIAGIGMEIDKYKMRRKREREEKEKYEREKREQEEASKK